MLVVQSMMPGNPQCFLLALYLACECHVMPCSKSRLNSMQVSIDDVGWDCRQHIKEVLKNIVETRLKSIPLKDDYLNHHRTRARELLATKRWCR